MLFVISFIFRIVLFKRLEIYFWIILFKTLFASDDDGSTNSVILALIIDVVIAQMSNYVGIILNIYYDTCVWYFFFILKSSYIHLVSRHQIDIVQMEKFNVIIYILATNRSGIFLHNLQREYDYKRHRRVAWEMVIFLDLTLWIIWLWQFCQMGKMIYIRE